MCPKRHQDGIGMMKILPQEQEVEGEKSHQAEPASKDSSTSHPFPKYFQVSRKANKRHYSLKSDGPRGVVDSRVVRTFQEKTIARYVFLFFLLKKMFYFLNGCFLAVPPYHLDKRMEA